VAILRDLRDLLALLRARGELVEIGAAVDAELEAPEIHRRVIAAEGPALVFRNVRGSALPLVTNLFGTRRRVELAFGPGPRELVERVAALPERLLPPSFGALWRERGLFASLARVGSKRLRQAPVTEVVERAPDLARLPATKSWPRDGGRFLTMALVYTEPPREGEARVKPSNLGLYRMQLFPDGELGLHVQIQKGGGFHLAEAERIGRPLPVNVFLGGPPAAILAAIAPLPENVPEMLLASLVLGERLEIAENPAGPLPVLAGAELCLVGEAPPGVRRPEGPFGDHYGYYSEVHDYPVFRPRALLRRRDAILPATVVGKPRQEDFFLGDFLQELLSPLFPLVMPGVRDLWSYGETGYHSLSAAVVRERYEREAMVSAFRILGEGQLSLTKFLLVLDRPVDLRDFRAVLEHVLARADLRTDLFVLANLSMDSLDYAGPRINEGSKGVLLGLGEPHRALPREFSSQPPPEVRDVRVFCPGCLVVEGPAFAAERDAPSRIARHAAFAAWPLVVLSDDAARAARSAMNFLWTTFTRFDPARDLHAAKVELVAGHAAYEPPLVLDARMKPGYPEELACDPETAATVTRRWKEYFPSRDVAMGDAERAHLD
jgi:UbiD family decarboxylase